ncbi:MAG: four helix bundle protein [Bacteroidia bacterium]
MTHNFEKLRIYQDSLALAKRTYKNFKSFPCFAIRDQILRSAVSIPSNIAEGSQRNSEKDFIKFLYYSKGSASELFTQFRIIEDEDDIDEIILRQLIADSRMSMKQIQAFLNHLQS